MMGYEYIHSLTWIKSRGIHTIMLNQFRRAIECAVIRGQAQHNMGHLHYIRATAGESASVYRANYSKMSWKPSQNGRTAWYFAHTPEGCPTFEQFHNGYYFNVHQIIRRCNAMTLSSNATNIIAIMIPTI